MSAEAADYNQGDFTQGAAKDEGGSIRPPAASDQNGGENGGVDIQDGEIQSTWHHVHETFDDMELNADLLRGIYGYRRG